jgi:type IV pilus assembly protein PilQ
MEISKRKLLKKNFINMSMENDMLYPRTVLNMTRETENSYNMNIHNISPLNFFLIIVLSFVLLAFCGCFVKNTDKPYEPELNKTVDYTSNKAGYKTQPLLNNPSVLPDEKNRNVSEQNSGMFLQPDKIFEPSLIKQETENKEQGNENPYGINLKTPEEALMGLPKQYSGEKIKLDFYETDIKNVFRMLKNIAGINFAIDKDVEGSVTLSIQDPVHWDQILDLVLKMNGLGYKKELNIIRIATLDTLKREQIILQDAIAERKKNIESQQSLEPLITEYIPISYASAQEDMKPHIDLILTKDRGRISVDKRTNTIIVTDIRSKIDQIREIIYRLDQVTPQIMIEARVVEVTKNFSRELGMGLSFLRGQTVNKVNNTTDYTVALNHPLSELLSTGSINIYNVLGSNFLSLQAKIIASETKGDLKIISSPRILTLDNKKAYIKQGIEYAYLERDSSGGASVKFKNIDLLLEVTPHVTPDKRIAMTVHLTKNDIASINEDGIPSLSNNEAETELLVNNKDTIVIGGIEKQTYNSNISGTPFLSSIPLIGRLFRTDSTRDNRNELLIFLTPSIIQLEQKREAYRGDYD